MSHSGIELFSLGRSFQCACGLWDCSSRDSAVTVERFTKSEYDHGRILRKAIGKLPRDGLIRRSLTFAQT
jgi:hypothetical protein